MGEEIKVLEFREYVKMEKLKLEFNITFNDLYSNDGLSKVDTAFIEELKKSDIQLYNILLSARQNNEYFTEEKEHSNFLIELAPHVEDFIGKLFSINKELQELATTHNTLANLYTCKRLYIQRQAAKKHKPDEAVTFNGTELESSLSKAFNEPFTELVYANHVNAWLDEKDKNEENINLATKYACWALHTEEGKEKHKNGILFKTPNKLDFFNLVPVETETINGITVKKLSDHELRYREGFGLTDKGGSLEQALDDANYCIFCHNQGKDSCSKGLKEKESNAYKKTIHNVNQAGCPLEEKISEMNSLKSAGVPLGALAVVAIDNPLCAATGHRICNDCMKSCIYQKQDPVNIPRTETRTLQDILDLPYGFEIYSLLTRWNPLNIERPLPKAESGYKVLVSGLGPAGFNLSHHLLNDGHTVIAIDGLKIEPLPSDISGITQTGDRVAFKPIKNINDIFENLGERVLAGFGGVAEYGITVRWNKNYLKVIRLLLERRQQFAMYGGIRFGSTITYNQAFKMGFDHIALCMGAGKPTVIQIPNAVSKGVRTASDFLMALQLTGAAKKDSIANLQLRLPVIVIGGGLTAIDTATESMAYYPIQVEKFLSRYETLSKEHSAEKIKERWNDEEAEIANEFITHARAIRLEREKAELENRDPDIISLLKSWGGVKLAYRRNLVESPAYRLNHEEVELAMQEGIEFIENATPVAVEIDKHRHAEALKVSIKEFLDGQETNTEKVLSAKAIFMAAGTNPNTVLFREDPDNFELDGKFFQTVNENGEPIKTEYNTSKPEQINIFMNKSEDNRFTSFFGDLHPSYVGNVVKAMGSAKQGYPIITSVLNKNKPTSAKSSKEFITFTNDELIATVHNVVRLTSTIIEVVIKAKSAARNFEPGQFYRFQNFENNAIKTTSNNNIQTTLAMEGIALTGAWVNKEKGLLSTIVLEMGGSSNICAHLKKGEPVIVMGPSGTGTEIPHGETVMLVGGGLGNAVLFSIGKALKQAGSKVLYFAGYKKAEDRYKVKEIEEASDKIIWACDEATFTPEREQDRAFHGNIVEAIKAYGSGMLGNEDIKLNQVDRIVAIGSDRMMAAVGQARHTVLKDFLKPEHIAIGSINSPMQCTMKEICAQCLQKHIDPKTGEEHYVYSCFNQDQLLDHVSFPHLNDRLMQNSVQEKLTASWITHCLNDVNGDSKKAA